MVATEQALASQVGADILRQGGNAIDAAVAVGFALAVVLPNAGNLGGGGFMLVRDAKTGKTHALDFRETAPASATQNMFLDQDGKVIPGKSTRTPYSVAVPGTVAGLIYAAQHFGSLPLSRLIAPAIKLAEDGFIVSPVLAQQFSLQRTHLERWPTTREVFFKRPWVLKSMMWAGKAAFFVWNIWHKLKDDLWTFYFFDINIGQPCSMTRSG